MLFGRIIMHALTRAIIFATLLIVPAARPGAQAQTQEAKEPTASITGHVTVGGKPAAGVMVTLTEASRDSLNNVAALFSARAMVKSTTDEEGRFRLERLAAGRYSITPFAPA